jgi:hypothetical protein
MKARVLLVAVTVCFMVAAGGQLAKQWVVLP